jgi:Uncharacterized conserved protein
VVSCQDKIQEQYKVLSPVYMSYSDLRKSVNTVNNKNELVNTGKIYYWNKYLFINEQGLGVHIIDNNNPAQPVFKTFINIPGNVDISIKDGILYADSYIDLVAIDISNLNDIKEVKRIDSIFTYTVPPVDENIKLLYDEIDPKKGVVTSFKIRTVEKDYVSYQRIYYPYYDYVNYDKTDNVYIANNQGSSNATNGTSIGVGGSTARISIAGNALYAINNSSTLFIFDISSVENFVKRNELFTSWVIETLFPYKDKLFIGSQGGMITYDITDPFQPSNESTFWHTTSCDPVVVEDNYAYVTLRNGTRCRSNSSVNRLDIINISNFYNPVLVKSYDMTNPHGLGIDNKILFICDGDAGLKIYDATDVTKLNDHLLATYPENKAVDVIPIDGVLLMIGEKGLYQYDYSNISDIKLLSKIEITK